MLEIINNIINNMKILKSQIIGLGSNKNLVKAYKELLKKIFQQSKLKLLLVQY